MDRENTIRSLKEDFPDMKQSILNDILDTCKGDKEAASNALRGIDGETKKENEKKNKRTQTTFSICK